MGFDFAVSEEVRAVRRVRRVDDVYGTSLLDVEHEAEGFAAACADPDRPASTVLSDRDLRTLDDVDYVC